MRLFGLIGYPLSHSFSKMYFTEKFLREGLMDCRYELFPIESISLLEKLISDHPGLAGLNVTIPYKEQVVRYLHQSFLPQGLQACNCIRVREGKLSGFNTDCTGFEKSLLPLLKDHHSRALILGTGGASAAVAYVFRKLGITFHIVSREMKKGVDYTYSDLSEPVIRDHPIIVNTTPVGMYPQVSNRPPIPYHFLQAGHLLYDLVYNPEKSLFLQKGEEMGAVIKNGLEMLEIQAQESWKIWNEN